MRRRLAGLLTLLLTLSTAAADVPASTPTRESVLVDVDVSRPIGRINRNLVGVDWKLGTGEGVTALRPDIARADIAFQLAAHEDGSFDWSFADSWVLEAKAAGAQPMLILDYTPTWLARTEPGDPRDPTKVAPRDMARWEEIVAAGVRHFVARGVRWFEVWNEPDWPGFWQDSPAAFLDTARHTALAVQRVARETGIRLHFGGPACLFPDPFCVASWLAMMRSIGMRPDFVSWHYYGNYPFVGPDGREPSLPEPAYLALGHRNPAGGVGPFPFGIEMIRSTVRAALAGSGWAMPELILDEWNVSGAGFDGRHDTHEGAAFDAGVLTEFQRAGLSRSAFFLSKDAYIGDPAHNAARAEYAGDWGLVSWKGTRKPAWWTFWLWRRMATEQVAATGSSTHEGFWVLASRERKRHRVTLLLSSFASTTPRDRTVQLRISGLAPGRWGVAIRRIDARHRSAARIAERRKVRASQDFDVLLPANSVAFVELVATR